jgi:hypothetical protein
MPLSAYKAPTKEIKIGETSTRVRGVNDNDLALLMNEFPDLMQNVISGLNIVLSDKVNWKHDQIPQILMQSINSFPIVAATIVALCCMDEENLSQEELVATTMELPLSIKLEILTGIFELTFTEGGAIKKFLAKLSQAKQTQQVQAPQGKTKKQRSSGTITA